MWSLEHSSLSVPLLFRMLIIALFAATDAWRFIRNPSTVFFCVSSVACSKPLYATESQLLGWILLFSLLSNTLQYTAIPSTPSQTRLTTRGVSRRPVELTVHFDHRSVSKMVSVTGRIGLSAYGRNEWFC